MEGENEGMETPEEDLNYKDYIEVIKKLKSETVSKESFEKLKEENKNLIETLANGGKMEGAETPQTEEEKKSEIKELRKALYGFNDGCLTNLEYITKTLRLRDLLIETEKKDPFLPFGHETLPTNQDIEAAERVARTFRECVEYANGDDAVFTNELQRRTADIKIPTKKIS